MKQLLPVTHGCRYTTRHTNLFDLEPLSSDVLGLNTGAMAHHPTPHRVKVVFTP